MDTIAGFRPLLLWLNIPPLALYIYACIYICIYIHVHTHIFYPATNTC